MSTSSPTALIDPSTFATQISIQPLADNQDISVHFITNAASDPFSIYQVTFEAEGTARTLSFSEISSILHDSCGPFGSQIVESRPLEDLPRGLIVIVSIAPANWEPDPHLSADEKRWQRLAEGTLTPSKPYRVLRNIQANYASPREWIFYGTVEGEFDDLPAAGNHAKEYSDNGDNDVIGLFNQNTLVAVFIGGVEFTPLPDQPSYQIDPDGNTL